MLIQAQGLLGGIIGYIVDISQLLFGLENYKNYYLYHYKPNLTILAKQLKKSWVSVNVKH